MAKELNLPLTERESLLVKVALIRWKAKEKRCVSAIKNCNVVSNVSDYERDLKDIDNILDKIEGMGEWDTSAKNT